MEEAIAMKKLMPKEVEMCSGPIFPNVIRYTIPIILTGLLQLFFNAADIIVVGRFCGSNAVGAVGATGSLTNLLVNLFIGFSVGVTVCTATALGAEQKRVVHRVVHTAIPLSIIGGALLTIVGIGLSGTLLRVMDTPSELINQSTIYLRIYFCGAIPNMVYNFGSAILRAAGDTKGPLKFLSLSGVVNVLLNVVFVTAFHMGVAGVALATIVSQALSAILVVSALMRRNDDCHLLLSQVKIYTEQLKKIITIGFPAGLQGMVFSMSNVLIQSSINSFGAASVAGNSAASNIEGFVYIAINAFSQTSVNFIGQNKGANNYARIKKVLTTCILSATVVGLSLSILAWAFARPLLSVYITDNPVAIEVGAIRITFFLTYFICGIMECMTGAIRGLGNTFAPMLISVLGVCGIRIGWILTIFRTPLFHSLESLYISYPISWVCCIICQVIVFNVIFKRLKRNYESKGIS